MKVRDPVCGMTVDSDHAAAKSVSSDGVVYFCSTACKKTYDARHRSSPS